MKNPANILELLKNHAQQSDYIYTRLYRNLYNPEFYRFAYQSILADNGRLSNDSGSAIYLTDQQLNKYIQLIKDRTYKPISVKQKRRQEQIDFDRLVSEIIWLLLNAIYEPTFSLKSYGYRPRRSAQSAVMAVQKQFTGSNWFINGKIESCFSSIDPHILINILRRRIKDEAFIQLLWKFIKAEYLIDFTENQTFSGTPNASRFSQIMMNIYFNELDRFLKQYAAEFDRGNHKKQNSEYRKATHKASYYRVQGNKIWSRLSPDEKRSRRKNLKALERKERQIIPTVPLDTSYKRLHYIRYADSIIIGVAGSKKDAETIYHNISVFTKKRLGMAFSGKVVHSSEKVRFLGYDIMVVRDQAQMKSAAGYRIRSQTGVVKLLIPREIWVQRLVSTGTIRVRRTPEGKEKYVALHRGPLVNSTDIEILTWYNTEINGLYQYYAIANNAFKIGEYANLMRYSMYKTYGCKYKCQVHEIKRRYCDHGVFTLLYQTRAGLKKTTFYRDKFVRRKKATQFADVDLFPQFSRHRKKETLKERKHRKQCELCGKHVEDPFIFQVEKLKDLNRNTPWGEQMLHRRQKALIVCPNCYKLINI